MGEGPKRAAIEVIVLMITGTVCAILILIAVGVAVVEIISPETDTSEVVSTLGSIVSTLLGAVFGLIVGHTMGRRNGGL